MKQSVLWMSIRGDILLIFSYFVKELHSKEFDEKMYQIKAEDLGLVSRSRLLDIFSI